jgi:hypothetical protein
MADSIEAFLAEWTRAQRAGDISSTTRFSPTTPSASDPLGFALPKPAWPARYRQHLA